MRPRTVLLACAAGALIGTGTGWYNAATAGTVTCGGQNWHVQAPVQCTKTRVIDGTEVSIYLREDADGGLAVIFTLGEPRATDTLIHVTSHFGNSDMGGPDTDPIGVIHAGALVGMLVIPHALCGQVDMRAIFDNKSGRVAGPYILNDSCAVTPPTTTPTSSPPSSGPTTVPQTTVPLSSTTTPGTAPPSTVPGTIPAGSKLVATGSNVIRDLSLGFAFGFAGMALIGITRRRV